jgi:hypothetical protein
MPPTKPDPIVRLLELLPPTDQLHYLAFSEAMYQARFTGPTTIHWKDGLPKQVDLGSPVRLSIVQPLDKGEEDPPR